ncbi:MAG: YHS domain-containing protein [Saprospiraceae bacterium]|nr:YHS domain-containing protein [Saprospiraceae bacterium]
MKNILIIIGLCFTTSLFAQTEKHDHKKMEASMKQTPIKQTEPLKEDGIDPVCKMRVRKGEKRTLVYNGKLYGFCADYCKEKFEEKPSKYLKQ